ncbi:MAG: branched-chain-amino-acid transaminase [Spirochaetales bacterium]
MSEPVIWIDGQWKTKETATVSVYDHGLLYGDGIFEGMRLYNGRVFRLEDHLVRLEESAKALLLTLPYSRQELTEVIDQAVARSGRREGYLRLVVTRGVGTLGLDPNRCPRASVILIVDGIQLYPAELYATGIPLITASTRRTPRSSGEARVKSLNYLNNILAKIEAQRAGCLEALMLNTDGLVVECTADNIFVVKNGVLRTPSAIHGALEGITRKTVLELAQGLKVATDESALALFDVYNADEAFLTGSGAEVMPVTELDGRRIGNGKPGPVTLRLLEAFRTVTQG